MANNKTAVIPIRRSWVMAVFLCAPVMFSVAIWDYYFNNGSLLPYMGFSTFFFPLYILIFEMPHIVASLLGFADKGYYRSYKKHLTYWLPILLVGMGLLYYIDSEFAIAVYLVVTMYHVIRQLTGVGHFFDVPKNILHEIWTWILIVGTSIIYVAFWLHHNPGANSAWINFGSLLVLLLGSLFAVLIAWRKRSFWALAYLGAVTIMFFFSLSILSLGYLFFSFFIVRIVHDVTAFMFYITHDMNRSLGDCKNFIYQIVPFKPWSLVLMVPLLAIALGFTVRFVVDNTAVTFLVVMMIGVMHYYLESVIWKRGAPHRKFVKVV
jgi:hypothetical protein